jgi:hypothetical protein
MISEMAELKNDGSCYGYQYGGLALVILSEEKQENGMWFCG